jgi:hypothetical protein
MAPSSPRSPAPSLAAGKTNICARMCGAVFSQRDQFADPGLSPWPAPDD